MTLPTFQVLAHIQNRGDLLGGPGEFVGTRGRSLRMEAFQITFTSPPDGVGLRYYAHLSFEGTRPWVTDGQLISERGLKREIEGFAIELTGAKLAEYDVHYMTHVQRSGDTAWVANGAFCGTMGSHRRAEGIAVTISPRVPRHIAVVSKARSGSGRPLAITASEESDDTAVYVSVADGSNLQVWDRRPVKGGLGFALINKARPTHCLARGPSARVILMHVSRIDTDDNCVWLDSRVNGTETAITSWSARDLRLRVGGARPYPEHGNDLIVHPWTNGVDNEVWIENDESYSVIAGTDDKALNVLSDAIYRGCYPEIFKGSIAIGSPQIAAVEYDMTSAPKFAIYNPQSADDTVREMFETMSPSEDDAPRILVVVERMGLTVIRTTGERESADALLTMGAIIRFNPDRSLSLHLGYGLLLVPMDPWYLVALNALFIPILLGYLNSTVLEHIRIPALRLFDVEFASPVLATRFPHALAASALPPDLSDLPPDSSRWPADQVFLGIDDAALDAVGKAALERLNLRGDWAHDKPTNICHLYLNANYTLTLANPRFVLRQAIGNQYTVRIDVRGSATFALRCGAITETTHATASGPMTATARVSVDERNHVIVTFVALDPPLLRWTFQGAPSWFDDKIIATVLMVFTPFIASVVSMAMRNRTFDVYAIPTIRPRIAGRTFEITLRDLALGSTADGEGKLLVLATGGASVKPE